MPGKRLAAPKAKVVTQGHALSVNVNHQLTQESHPVRHVHCEAFPPPEAQAYALFQCACETRKIKT
jgi:hypothetical protein